MADSEFLAVYKERGFFHQCTDEKGIADLFSQQNTPVYIGFDCTAPTLHVGSLVQIMILRWLQKYGCKPIVLLGGGTTKIGDPSGKDQTRQLKSHDEIHNNMQGIRLLLEKFITFDNSNSGAVLVNNDDWLTDINYIDFLRTIGRHFSVNRMLGFDSVKLRLDREQTLSFLEFNYMIFQAYDFVELHKRYDCRLQIGGSDQWGNIVNGIELNRRLGNKEIYGLTTPLITTASGDKMGKTAAGAVWLTADDMSPYDYWQFWRNVEDKDVGRFLKLFTELPLDEINKLEMLQGSDINEAKIILANEATTLCHGKTESDNACETARKTFAEGGAGEALPVVEYEEKDLSDGIPVVRVLQEAGLADSGGAAKRLIAGGGLRVNGEKQLDSHATIHSAGKISAGKKRHAIIKIKGA